MIGELLWSIGRALNKTSAKGTKWRVYNIMKTHTSNERKPSRFKILLFLYDLVKMRKLKTSEV